MRVSDKVLIKCSSVLTISSPVRFIRSVHFSTYRSFVTPALKSIVAATINGDFYFLHHLWVVWVRFCCGIPRPLFYRLHFYYLHYRRKPSSQRKMRWCRKCECAFYAYNRSTTVAFLLEFLVECPNHHFLFYKFK